MRSVAQRRPAEAAAPAAASEAALRNALRAAAVGVWQIDVHRELITCDAICLEMLGLSDEHAELELREFLARLAEEERPQVQMRLQAAVLTGSFESEHRLVRPDGSMRWVRATGSRIPAPAHAQLFAGVVTDITTARDAEEAIARREDAIRLLEQATNIGIYETGADTKTIGSSTFFRQLGVSDPQDFGFEAFLELVHPDDREKLIVGAEEMLRTKDMMRTDFRIVRPDTGEVRWFSSLSRLFRDPAGVPVRSIGAQMDVTEQRRFEEELRASREQLAVVVNQTAVGLVHRDLSGRVLMVNDRFCELVGRSRDELDGLPAEAFTHPDDAAHSAAMLAAHMAAGSSFEITKRYLRPDGSILWCDVQVSFVRNAAGEPTSSITVATDISKRKRAELELLSTKALSQSIVDSSADCIALLDLEERILFMNHSGLAGIEADGLDRLMGKPWRSFWRHKAQPQVNAALEAAYRGGTGRFTASNPTMRGVEKWWDVLVTPVCDTTGAPIQLLTIARDITEQRTAAEQTEWAATHDPLTRLPNRRLFQRRLEELLASGSDQGGALLLVDLDRFKEVNDTLGHAAGDGMLDCFADRVRSCLEADQLVARLGGDEFAILLPGLSSQDAVDGVVGRLAESLRAPYLHDRHEIQLRASIGSALFPSDACETSDLLKCADLALYAAKACNRGGLMHFDREMLHAFSQRAGMIARARDVLAHDSLVPVYQPQLRPGDGSIYGVEALLRWRDEAGALRGPGEIVAAFDDPALAQELGRRMHELVLSDLKQWLRAGCSVGHVAINAAASEFRHDDFAERLLESIARHGIAPGLIQIEITESVFIGDHADRVARALALLSTSGVSIALDDFGTGFSSLSHLKDFPVDVLKIDRSFVQTLDEGKNEAIVKAVLNLGASLDLAVIAEGVETEAQLDFMARHGCTAAQGFLLHRPLPASEIAKLLAR